MANYSLKRILQIAVIVGAVYLIVNHFTIIILAIGLLFHAAAPLLLGCAMAFVLNILLKGLEKIYFPHAENKFVQKSRRPICIFLSFLIVIIFITLLLKLVIPEIISSVELIGKEMPVTVNNLLDWIIANSDQFPVLKQTLENFDSQWPETTKDIIDYLLTGAGGVLSSVFSVVGAVVGTVVNIVLGMIFSIYILMRKEKLKSQFLRIMKAYMKPAHKEKLLYVLRVAYDTFSHFIIGQVTEAVIIGVLCALCMTILKFPYAAMTGTVVGVTALIPIVGAYIGALIGAFMIFTINPLQALLFLVFLVILQQVEGNIIYPKVVGASIGLPGLWVLAAVTIGGSLLGIAGMLLGVPITATLYKLLANSVDKRLTCEKEQKD